MIVTFFSRDAGGAGEGGGELDGEVFERKVREMIYF